MNPVSWCFAAGARAESQNESSASEPGTMNHEGVHGGNHEPLELVLCQPSQTMAL
jgi:hypothetical protein